MDGVMSQLRSRVYQQAVTVAGLALWLAAFVWLASRTDWRAQLPCVAFVPAIIIASMFVQHFRMPSGLKFTHERLTFTLSDAIVLLAACWYGFAPAVFIAGIEGFTTSRRTVRRLSSNLFSGGMMALTAAAAALTLNAVFRYAFNQPDTGAHHTALAVAVAMFVASLAHNVTNVAFISTLLALRHAQPIMRSGLEKLLSA